MYCFIFGNNPLLSLAEVFSVARRWGLSLRVKGMSTQVLVVKTDDPFDAAAWQKTLGGTVKICRITHRLESFSDCIRTLSPDIVRSDLLAQQKKKIIYGFSYYGDSSRRYQNELDTHGMNLKRRLKEAGLSVRVLSNGGDPLSSVQVTKEKIIERGADICVIGGFHNHYIAKTLTVQAFESYSSRDYGRPQRDARSGMLPPKLAQMMINLTECPTDQILLDPFCGSGTILQEAALLGYTNLVGSDISATAIQDTRSNLDWILEKTQKRPPSFDLYHADVTALDQEIEPNSVQAIVTEPYLGPPLHKSPTWKDMLRILPELESLYLRAFDTYDAILKPDGRIVTVFPLFKAKHGTYALKILETLQKKGFSRINPIPEAISPLSNIGPTARGSIVYGRPDQRVERELFIFERKKAEVLKSTI